MEVLVIAAIVGIPLLIVLIVSVKRAAAGQQRTLEQTWADFARSRKLLFHQADPRVFAAQSIRITGSVDDVKVTIETVRKQDDDGARSFTKITGRTADPLPFEGQLYAELPFAGLAKALGAQDVETGDELFDDRFTVKASSESAMREHLTTEVRAALLELPGDAYVRFEDGGAAVEWRGHETDAKKLEDMLTLITILVRSGSRAHDAAAEPAPARRPSRRRREEEPR